MESNVAIRVWVTIAGTGWTSARIRFANPGNRPPKIIMVFRFPCTEAGFSHCDIHQRQQASQFNRLEGGGGSISDLNRNLIVKSWGSTQARCSIVAPECTDERLLRRSL